MADHGILVAVRLTPPEAKLLEFVADRGGEVSWDWSRCRPDVTRMVRGLVDDKRMLAELVSAGRIRLTDQGRSAVSQIRDALQRRTVLT